MVISTFRRRKCARWEQRGLRHEKFRLSPNWQQSWPIVAGAAEPFAAIAGLILGWMLGHGGFMTVKNLKFDQDLMPFRFDDFDEMVETMAGLGIVQLVK